MEHFFTMMILPSYTDSISGVLRHYDCIIILNQHRGNVPMNTTSADYPNLPPEGTSMEHLHAMMILPSYTDSISGALRHYD